MSEPLTPEQMRYESLNEHCAVVEHCLKNAREEAEELRTRLVALEAAGKRLEKAGEEKVRRCYDCKGTGVCKEYNADYSGMNEFPCEDCSALLASLTAWRHAKEGKK